MNKILIIGSKGFIGQNLKKHFEKNGYLVWCADVVVDYANTGNYFVIDATNSDYREVFEKENYDICINCAGAASVPDSLLHPHRDYSLNAINVFKLLDSIRLTQPNCKFINLSSAAVYGNPGELPIRESHLATPVSPYGYHKFMSEQICKEFYQFFGIATCSLRIFSAYGEGLRKQLFWDLYQKAKTRTSITLFGSGLESRDFIYIDDLVQAIRVLATQGDFKGQAINVANGEEVFIKDCVATFYSLFDYGVPYHFSGQQREGDPNNWVADISILTKLGYKREFSLMAGLTKYYQWIKELD